MISNRFLIGVAVLIVFVAILVFNGGSSTSTTTTIQASTSYPVSSSSSSTSTTPTSSSSSSTSTSTTISSSNVIIFNVTLRDYTITPNVFVARAGQTVYFNVTNWGTYYHDLGIWGLGSAYGTPQLNGNGGKGVFQFSSTAPGNYFVYSNVNNDQNYGMNAILSLH